MISSQRNALVLMLRRWAARAGHRGSISGCYRRQFEGIDSERGIRLARGRPQK